MFEYRSGRVRSPHYPRWIRSRVSLIVAAATLTATAADASDDGALGALLRISEARQQASHPTPSELAWLRATTAQSPEVEVIADDHRRNQDQLQARLNGNSLTQVMFPGISLKLDQLEDFGPAIMAFQHRHIFAMLDALARNPNARALWITTQEGDPQTYDRTGRFVFGDQWAGVKQRITALPLEDPSVGWLERKVLDQVRQGTSGFAQTLRHELNGADAVLYPYNVTLDTVQLALELGMPIVGADPQLRWTDSKSALKFLAELAEVPIPDVVGAIHSVDTLYDAFKTHVRLGNYRLWIKSNGGTTTMGNARLTLPEAIAREIARADNPQALLDVLSGKRSGPGIEVKYFSSKGFAGFFGDARAMLRTDGFVMQADSPGLDHSVQLRLHANPQLFDEGVELLSNATMRFGENEGFDGMVLPHLSEAPGSSEGLRRSSLERATALGRVLRKIGVVGDCNVDFSGDKVIEVNVRWGAGVIAACLLRARGARFEPTSGQHLMPDGSPVAAIMTDHIGDTLAEQGLSLRGQTAAEIWRHFDEAQLAAHSLPTMLLKDGQHSALTAQGFMGLVSVDHPAHVGQHLDKAYGTLRKIASRRTGH